MKLIALVAIVLAFCALSAYAQGPKVTDIVSNHYLRITKAVASNQLAKFN